MSARALAPLLALASLASGCGAAQDRPEPPSGAVDPGVHGLTTPGAERAPPPQTSAGPALPAVRGLDPQAPPPSSTAHAPAAPPIGQATGKMVMAREHCEALGRKFTELALKQGAALGALGVDSSGDAEAVGVGRTFSEKCARDLGGQEVEVREYQCMLRAETAEGLTACKK